MDSKEYETTIEALKASLIRREKRIKELIEENKRLAGQVEKPINESVWIWWGNKYYVLVPDGVADDGFERYKLFSSSSRGWLNPQLPMVCNRYTLYYKGNTSFSIGTQRALFDEFRKGKYETDKFYHLGSNFVKHYFVLHGIGERDIGVMYRKNVEVNAQTVFSELIKMRDILDSLNRGDQ